MDYERLAEILFPDITKTPEDIEAMYPPRNLPEGAKVTRFAPSPTGFVHLGGLYQTIVGERLAHQSGGVFYLRIEDTDDKREVKGAAQKLINTLAHYGIRFDEGAVLSENGEICYRGNYGPYKQSERGEIYRVYAKALVKKGLAYPVFSTKDELKAIEESDKKAEVKSREWSEEFAASQKEELLKLRCFTLDDVEKNMKEGNPFVIRMLASGNGERKERCTDLIKGDLEFPENDRDEIILKSSGIPPYHFAHAVDDHLMGTTHVIRGEEWLPSLPVHVQLFKYLGFRLPKYMHTAQVMSLDANGNKKKLSKRDMGASMDDYTQFGYAPECVREYLLTVLNSNFEEWRAKNPDSPYTDFPFSIKKMSTSGCLIDFEKLEDISKNIISRKTADEVYTGVTEWAKQFDTGFATALTSDEAKAKAILSIGRGGKKPRKDYGTWKQVKDFVSFFYNEYFTVEDNIEGFDKNDIRSCLEGFAQSFDACDDQNTWFGKIKTVAEANGFCPDMKEFKASPDKYKGSVADVSSFIRVAITGRLNSPDLYTVIQILGKEETVARVNKYKESL